MAAVWAASGTLKLFAKLNKKLKSEDGMLTYLATKVPVRTRSRTCTRAHVVSRHTRIPARAHVRAAHPS